MAAPLGVASHLAGGDTLEGSLEGGRQAFDDVMNGAATLGRAVGGIGEYALRKIRGDGGLKETLAKGPEEEQATQTINRIANLPIEYLNKVAKDNSDEWKADLIKKGYSEDKATNMAAMNYSAITSLPFVVGTMMGAGHPTEKYQHPPTEEGQMGVRRVIAPLSEPIFNETIKAEGYPGTFSDYQREYPKNSHVLLEQKPGNLFDGKPEAIKAGPPEESSPKPAVAVPTLDELARGENARKDEEYRPQAPNEMQEIKVGPNQEPGKPVPTLDDLANGHVAGEEQPERPFPLSQAEHLDYLEAEIKNGEPGKRGGGYNPETGESFGYGVPSTYPDWFKNKRYTRKETLNIIGKAKEGKALTEKQQYILDDLLHSSRNEILNRYESTFPDWMHEQEAYTPEELIGEAGVAGLVPPDQGDLFGEWKKQKAEEGPKPKQADLFKIREQIPSGKIPGANIGETPIDMMAREQGKRSDLQKQVEAAFGPGEANSLVPNEPVNHGDFGPIYTQFMGKPKEAIDHLMMVKQGEAVGALHHPEVGQIDLPWGEPGTGKHDGYGLSKIVQFHPEMINTLGELIPQMDVVSKSRNRINLELENHRAAVRLDWNGRQKRWLLTAFEKEKGSSETGGTSSGPRSPTAGPTTPPVVEPDSNIAPNSGEVNSLLGAQDVDPLMGVRMNRTMDEALRQYMPGYDAYKGLIKGIKSLGLPTSIDKAHLRAAEVMGEKIGTMHRQAEIAIAQLEPHMDHFTKLGVFNEDIPLKENPGIKFMSDMSQGREQPTPELKAAATKIKALFDDRVRQTRALGTGALEQVRENYFPGMWKEKTGPVNFLSKRPLEGGKSFTKQKVFDDIMDGINAGFTPISNNPIDLVKLKLAEMDRYIMFHKVINEFKPAGGVKFVPVGEKPSEGLFKIDDKYGTVHGKPSVTIKEAFDRRLMDQLEKLAQDLGIPHERVQALRGGHWGEASTAGDIKTRFAGPESVIAHEIGHQLDWRYGLQGKLFGRERPLNDYFYNKMIESREKKGIDVQALKDEQVRNKELRDLADLRYQGQDVSDYFKKYVRKGEEKMAVMMEALVAAPDKFREVAPNVYSYMKDFADRHTEIKPLFNLERSLVLGTRAIEKPLPGFPVIGHHYATEAVARILNNYASSSLYNSPYFGKAFEAYMGLANGLNQAQLGLGSQFHAGFTTSEAVVSKNAEVFKDIYGLIKGNRSFGNLEESMGNALTSPVTVPFKGHDFLKEWRNPTMDVDPGRPVGGIAKDPQSRLAVLAKAAEMAGASFKIEKGLTTAQTEAAFRNWYGKDRLKAAARSPVAAVELMSKPLMEGLVPRQKAGLWDALAGRIIEQNPDKSLLELRPELRQAWNRVDARLGQVVYDRLFMNNVAKNVIQALVRAPGWTGGTIAEIGGALGDTSKFLTEWVSKGRMPENLPDRVAYVLSLAASVAVVNGVLTYALTGTMPHGTDFWAFRDGGKDDHGNPTRWLLPTYAKDVYAYLNNPVHSLIAKMHPLASIIGDIFLKNKDYYGVQIHNPDDPRAQQWFQDGKYVVKAFAPFWIRGIQKIGESSGGVMNTLKTNPAKIAGPLVGIMPATGEYTKTAAQKLMDRFMAEKLPEAGRTQEQFDRSQLKKSVLAMMRNGNRLTPELQQKFNSLPQKQRDQIQKEAKSSPFENAYHRLDVAQAIRVWKVASPEEQAQIRPILQKKITRAVEDGKMTWESARELTGLTPYASFPKRRMVDIGIKKIMATR